MRRRTRLILLAAAVGLIVPTAIDSPASAVDQDLTLSATSGAAGTEVTAASASCEAADSDDGLGILSVRLISGTGDEAVLAGIAVGIDDTSATFVIPDWIDPTDDAVVEATCLSIDFTTEESPTEFTYDPVAFDVEGSAGTPVQARTYSRTSLLAGQAFQVDGSGCFLDDAEAAFVEVAQGSDLSFRTATNFVAMGTDESGETFSVPTAMSNGDFGIGIVQSGDDSPVVDSIEEQATDIPAGTYSSISYCTNDEGVSLLFQPQLIEITGDAPFGDIDLTVPAESRTATLAGGSCTTGEVNLELYATDIDDAFGSEPIEEPLALRTYAVRSQSPAAVSALRAPAGSITRANDAWARTRGASGTRALADEEVVAAVAAPNAAGAWTFSDDVGFDNGVVEGYSWCGDPLADGFIYDPQAAVVSVTEVVPVPVPPTVPAPPANAVSGTPTYAG